MSFSPRKNNQFTRKTSVQHILRTKKHLKECFGTVHATLIVVSGNKVPSSVLIPIRRLRNPRSLFLPFLSAVRLTYLGLRFFMRRFKQQHFEGICQELPLKRTTAESQADQLFKAVVVVSQYGLKPCKRSEPLAAESAEVISPA